MHKIKLNREIDSWGYARYLLEYDLSQVPEGEPVVLEVDSLGGDVMEALSISNMLQERGNITAHIVGFCASAATWLCYACDRVVINDDCAFLIHKCSSYVDAWGMMNSDEIDQLIEKLKSEKKSNEAIDLIIANKYVKHAAGKSDMKSIMKLMHEERWILPSEALELGLVDEVSEDHLLSKTNMAARLHVMNKMSSLPPLPEQFSGQREAVTAAQPAEKSFMQQLKAALTEFFGGAVANLSPISAGTLSTEEEPSTHQIIMNEEFQFINALLGCNHLEETDGHVTLTTADLKQINDRLGEMEALSGQNTTLTTERDTARQDLADATAEIDGISDEVAALSTISEKVAAIKNVLRRAAGSSTENHSQNEGDGHAAVSDPVNRIVQPYRR